MQQSAIQGYSAVESKALMKRILAELFQLADPKAEGKRLQENKDDFDDRKENVIEKNWAPL